MLDIAVSWMLRHDHSYAKIYEDKSNLNIRVVNLLAAVRFYLDHLYQHVDDCFSDGENAIESIKAKCANEYDGSPDYRFMEALRNHAQHNGMPVHNLRYGSSWSSLGDDGLLEFSVDIECRRADLENDPTFKKSVLQECDEVINLKASSRSYVASISLINQHVRDLNRGSVDQARSRIESIHQRYAESSPGDSSAISALLVDKGEVISSIPLLLDWDYVRVKLQRQNRGLVNLAKRIVTSKI